jgi:hypothetical protein
MGFERLASKWKTKTRASETDLSKKKKLFLSDLSKPMIGMSHGEVSVAKPRAFMSSLYDFCIWQRVLNVYRGTGFLAVV